MNTGNILYDMDFNKIITHCDKTIKEEQEKIKIYSLLIDKLKDYDGKLLTKRIDKRSQIDGYYIHHTKSYGNHHLYIRSKTSNFNFDMSLCDYNQDKLSINHLKKSLISLENKVKKDIEVNKNITEILCIYNVALKQYKIAEENLKNLPGFCSLDRW